MTLDWVHLIFLAEYIPRLFLSDSEYEKLMDYVVLNPHWLMSMMKVIMELSTKNNEAELSNEQILKLVEEGVADLEVLNTCWKKYIPSSESPSAIGIDHLCLIFQAYCLIHPISKPSDEEGTRNFLIPCKLPDEIENSTICRIIESYTPFYFDFNEFLPDEIYHRLICLISTMAKPPQPEICNYYSKQRCFFSGIMGTNLITEKDEARQRLKIKVL